MGFFQVGFEITRLPKDTTMSTPMFGDKMKNNANNNIANTSDSTAGIRVGVGSSIFQVAGSVCSDRFAMATMLSGVYVVAASYAVSIVVRSPFTVSPSARQRPILALVGTVMASAFAATVLPKPNNDRFDTSGATGVTKSKSL